MSSSESDDNHHQATVTSRSVSVLAGSSNYAKWARSVIAYLMSKNLLSALKDAPLSSRATITGGPIASTITDASSAEKDASLDSAPNDTSSTRTNASAALSTVSRQAAATADTPVSNRKNERAWSYLYLHLSDTVQNNLSPEAADAMNPNAMLLWLELRRNYGVSSLQELGIRMEVIWGTQIPEREDPDRYFARMRSAYNDVVGNKTPFSDDLFAIALLRSLPSTYSVIAQTLFQRTKLSSEDVISSVRTEWQRQDSSSSSGSAALSANAYPSSRPATGYRKDKRENRGNSNRDSNSNDHMQWSCPIHRTNGHELSECRTVLAKLNRQSSTSSANVANTSDRVNNDPSSAYVATAFIATALFAKNAVDEFHIDSGASNHLTFDAQRLINPVPWKVPITIGDGRTLMSTHKGDIWLTPGLFLQDVLLVPKISCNLISVQQLTRVGHSVRFYVGKCFVFNLEQKTVAVAQFQRGLYTIQASTSPCSSLLAHSADLLSTWHGRLGHLNSRDVFDMGKAGMLGKGSWSHVTYKDIEDTFCVPCILGKGKRQPSPVSNVRATKPNQIVHVDIWGPARTLTIGGARYMMTCYDDYTRRLQVFFLKKKSHAADAFRDYIALVNNQCDTKIKVVRTDNGGESTSERFQHLLSTNGIQANRIPPDAHAQNARVERGHLTIFNLVRTLLIDSGLPSSFWAEAAAYACQIRNRIPNKGTGKVPQELWQGRSYPSYDHFRAFGSHIFVRDHRQQDKLKPRYFAARLMGWQSDSDSIVKYWDPRTRTMGYSRDVVYSPHDAEPGPRGVSASPIAVPERRNVNDDVPNDLPAMDILAELNDLDGEDSSDESVVDTDEVVATFDINDVESDTTIDVQPEQVTTSTNTTDQDSAIRDTPTSPASRIPVPLRSRSSSKYHFYKVAPVDELAPKDIARNDGVPSYIDDSGKRVQPSRKKPQGSQVSASIGVALVAHNGVPQSYRQAQASEDWPMWWTAILDELAKMARYGVWVVVPRSSADHTLEARWVFTRKIDGETGLPSAYKARWVAKGYRQVEGLDYNETFASVVHKDTVRAFLALVNDLNLECDQVDITAAFLNGVLKETIFLEPPEGANVPPGHVLLLKKSLYGLKQSPRCFNDALDKWLRSENFQPSIADPCLYVYNQGAVFMAIIVHVDDQLIASNDRRALDDFKKRLNARFECKDSGPVNYFLGFNVHRDRKNRTLSISQRHYLEGVLEKFGMKDSHPARTPFPSGFQARPATDQEFAAAKHLDYPQLAGSILYAATISRPDLSFPAGTLARYISKWSREHYNAAKHLLRYIRGTVDTTLTFKGTSGEAKVVGFADADWGGCLETRRSTTGYVFNTFGGVTSWRSRRQSTVALSTCEAELMACTDAIKQALWLQQLCQDLGVALDAPISIYNDNNGAIALSENPVDHDRSKHMGIRTHFVRDRVREGVAKLERVSTHDNPADIFTKSLPSIKQVHFSDMMGMIRR